MKKEGMSRQGFWIFIIIVLAVIVFSFVLFYSISDRFQLNYIDVDGDLIQQGVDFEVSENSVVRFNYSGKSYSVFFDEFSEDKAKIKIGLQNFNIEYSVLKEIDLNKDSRKDLILEIGEKGEKRVIYLEIIENENCIENWECTEWGPCIQGRMKRVCLDQNQCETVEFKPEVQMSC